MKLDSDLVAETLEQLGMYAWVYYPSTSTFEDYGIFSALGHVQIPMDQNTLLELIHKEDHATYLIQVGDFLSNDIKRMNLELRLKDSAEHYRWHQFSAVLVSTPQGRKIVGFAQDVHDKKLKEEKLHQLATKDNLSGAYNKSMGMVLFERIRNQCARNGSPMRVMVFEIPNLKSLNDLQGVDVGNKLIQSLCQFIRESMLPTDVFCRLEGVSFLLVQGGQDETTLAKFSYAIDNKIQEYNVRNRSDFPLTYRMGCAASLRPGGETAESLVGRARQNLQSRVRAR